MLKKAVLQEKCVVNILGRRLISSEEEKLVVDPAFKVAAHIAMKHGIEIWYHDLDNEFDGAFEERSIDKTLFDVFSEIVTGNGKAILHSHQYLETEKPSHINSAWPIRWKSLSTARVRKPYHAHIALALKSDDDGKWSRGVHFPISLSRRMTAGYVSGLFIRLLSDVKLPSEERVKIEKISAILDECIPRWRKLERQEEASADAVEEEARACIPPFRGRAPFDRLSEV